MKKAARSAHFYTIKLVHDLKSTARDQEEIALKVQAKFGGDKPTQSTISKWSKQETLSKAKMEYETRKRGGAGAPPKDSGLELKLMEKFAQNEKDSGGMGKVEILALIQEHDPTR